ncbi:AMIN-like domain-containing (lipo)protein [Kocuria aegyptia]|uniref:AMIN-like domain-containing protein n=1 Tax=Kocuria aegyptia TaxID=330943 RepID=A0ABP4WMA0_9MICC
MKKLISWLAAVVLAMGLGLIVPSSANAAAPYCGITWGSTPKNSDVYTSDVITNVRSGRHACFDRLVVDLRGKHAPGYRVQYVAAVHEDGSGKKVPLRGAADLQIIVHAPAYQNGKATYLPKNRKEVLDVSDYRTFRQVAWAGSFEGQTTLGLGVRARLPYRVFVLDGPGKHTRLVVDVAHRW